jgi:hypothetical protein
MAVERYDQIRDGVIYQIADTNEEIRVRDGRILEYRAFREERWLDMREILAEVVSLRAEVAKLKRAGGKSKNEEKVGE